MTSVARNDADETSGTVARPATLQQRRSVRPGRTTNVGSDRSGRVFGYCRVSTDRQVDGTSIDEQKRRIRGAAAMLGTAEPTIFSDEGVSGSIPLGNRPQGELLLVGLQPGDTVIASKLDRVFRDATDALIQARAFGEAGVDLILLDLGADS